MITIARILLTLAAIQWGLIPLMVDLTETHVFKPDWPPHARLHAVWLLSTGAVLAVYAVGLLWTSGTDKPHRLRHASVIGAIVLAGFFIAALTTDMYGGAFTELAEPDTVFGINTNIFAFSAAAILQAIGAYIIWTKLPKQNGG
jgi:hypothetical protein